MNLFRRKAPVEIPAAELPPVSLADEAVSVVGFHDAQRAEGIARMEELDSRLEANIRREMAALSDLRAELARERAAEGVTPEATAIAALEAADRDIETALEIDLNLPDAPVVDEIGLHDQVADEIERNLKDRRNGTERRPKRASEKAVMAVAGAA